MRAKEKIGADRFLHESCSSFLTRLRPARAVRPMLDDFLACALYSVRERRASSLASSLSA